MQWVASLRDLTYEERLEKVNLPTPEERRIGNIIMLYKCAAGKDKLDVKELEWEINFKTTQ